MYYFWQSRNMVNALMRRSLRQPREPDSPVAELAGPTDAEVLASDLRLRRTLAGGSKTSVTGGLAGSQARITMPTLVGT